MRWVGAFIVLAGRVTAIDERCVHYEDVREQGRICLPARPSVLGPRDPFEPPVAL